MWGGGDQTLPKRRSNSSGSTSVSRSLIFRLAFCALVLATLWNVISTFRGPGVSQTYATRIEAPHLIGAGLSTKRITEASETELLRESKLALGGGVGTCKGRYPEGKQGLVIDDESYVLPESAKKAIDANFEFADLNGEAHKDAAIGRNTGEFSLLHQIVAIKCEEAMNHFGECITGETGFASAASAITMLDAHAAAARRSSKTTVKSTHYAIDPYQQRDFRNIGARGVANYFKNGGPAMDFYLLNETASLSLSAFVKTRTCFHVLFLDDGHRFEQNIMELALAVELVPVGGVIVMHDTWMASIQATRSWVETNLANATKVIAHKTGHNMMVLVKIAPDKRSWQHFEPFKTDYYNYS